MILSNYFVFIHFPKTGGSFFRELCRKHAPPEWEIEITDDHRPIRDLPDKYRNLPVIGFVRNPYDWYVSWYFYLKGRGDNEFFNRASGNGNKTFKETMLAIFEMDLSELFEINCFYSSSSYGCYMNYMFGNKLDALRIGKFEKLRNDLFCILNGIIVLPEEFKRLIIEHPKINVGHHNHYRIYYDEELRKIVYDRDKLILEKFDYLF